MEIWLIAFLCCALLGVVVGFFAGLFGIGGGMLIVPVLFVLMPYWGFESQQIMVCAIGTSFSTIILTALSSLRTHHKNGNIDWAKIWPLSVGVALATTVVATFAEQFSADSLRIFFACCMFILALKIGFIGNRSSKGEIGKPGLLVLGSATGGISSLLGIGGGAIIVPALVWFQVHMRTAIGSAAVCTFVVAVFGTAGYIFSGLNNQNLPHLTLGYVYLPAFVGIVATSIFTAPVGANLANRLPVNKLKKIFALFLICASLKMLFS